MGPYTINQESRYLWVRNVPALGGEKDLIRMFTSIGPIEESRCAHEVESEQFTETYLIKYSALRWAREAKRKFHKKSFLGGILSVKYAPELESVVDIRNKHTERRQTVAALLTKNAREARGEPPPIHRAIAPPASRPHPPVGAQIPPPTAHSVERQVLSVRAIRELVSAGQSAVPPKPASSVPAALAGRSSSGNEASAVSAQGAAVAGSSLPPVKRRRI